MRHFPAKAWLLIIGWLALTAPARAGDFFVRDGDRVVFLGDSITEQRLYTTYVEAYTLTRFPQWKLQFRNVGWGGDTSWLRQRSHPNEGQLFAASDAEQQKMVEAAVKAGLERDVLPLKPTVVTIDFGMNDHGYREFNEPIFRAYVRSQTQLVKVLQQHDARVALLTPQPIEDKRPDPDKDVRNLSLRKFSDGLQTVATQTGALFVDQFDPYLAVLRPAHAKDPNAFVGAGDAVHPGPVGHTLMAWAILKGLRAPALVSRAELSVDPEKVAATDHCQVTNLKVAGGVVSFDRLDEALPMPIDPRAEKALQLVPLLDDLDRYELKVTGLKATRYRLVIDGEPAATLTAADLANGCNLATTPGPVAKPAQEILAKVVAKNDLYYQRWRAVQLYEFPAWAKGLELEARRAAELARLDQQIAALESEIDATRRPKTHHFELQPQ